MTLKSAFKYQLVDHKNSIIIFYICIFAMTALTFFSAMMSTNNAISMVGGFEFATMIFLFVTGLNSFSESFRMLAQNGVSRKSMFQARMAVFAVLAFGMAIIDKIINLIGDSLASFVERFHWLSLYDQLFARRAAAMNGFVSTLESTLFDASLYLAALGLGYFITIMYYRLDKNGKIAVSVGVPVGLMVGLPILERFISGGRIARALYRFILFAFGIRTATPYASMTTFCISFLVLCGLGWLMMRRAAVKA